MLKEIGQGTTERGAATPGHPPWPRPASVCPDLFHASVVGADLSGADLSHALVYGLSAWDVDVTGADQTDLVITKAGDPPVTVDDLDVAQFLYLLIENRHIRNMIETITTKLVLILGRKPQRKPSSKRSECSFGSGATYPSCSISSAQPAGTSQRPW